MVVPATGEATILHADLDAFYASVVLLTRPALVGKPMVVGGGVVLSATCGRGRWAGLSESDATRRRSRAGATLRSPPMASDSKRFVILALVANVGIAITKFFAAAISGSSAMLSEGIHSLADSGNQLFLLRGHAASRFAASEQHPYGRGKEIYFWSFMVAVFLFVGGSVISIISGIARIRDTHGHGGEGFWLSMAVLGIAAFFEGAVAFRPAVKEFNGQRAGRSLRKTIRESKDPSLLVVLFEDSAAMVGLAIAAVGLTIARLTENVVWDGIASVLIGLLLAAVAWVLAVELKSLLIGESATREERAKILAAALSVGDVHTVDRLLTMQLAPDEILVTIDVEFDEGLDGDRIESAIASIEARVSAAVPDATRIFIEPVDR